MKLTGILLLITVLHVSAGSFAQSVTYSAKAEPLTRVLSAIEKQTGYNFFYNEADLRGSVPVTAELKGVSLQEALEIVLTNQPVKFDIQGNTISLLRKKENTALSSPVMTPPPTDVHGHITDSLGAPLAGASVTVKGTKKGTQTDANGDFSLTGLAENATLKISFAGFESQEIKLNGRQEIRLILKITKSTLDETVVIPYGTTTKRLNTGNVTTVTAKEIEQQPVSNPLAALIGRVPGLVITQVTGALGGAFTVQIRGQNSLTNGNDPFYVIDGVPYSSQLPGELLNSNLYGGSPLNFIDPYDIESIDVLKDADATSIYGSRAANGAILITTKKGKAGVMRLDANVSSGFTRYTRLPHILNNQQYLAMRHEAFANDNATPGPADHDVNGDWDSTHYTNWPKLLLTSPSHYTNAELSASGGSANTQYLIGGGFNKQTTGFPRIFSKDGAEQRASTHFSINSASADQRLKMTLTGSYVWDQNTSQPDDFTRDAVPLPTDAPPIFNADGTLNWAPKNPGEPGTWTNPFSNLFAGYRSQTSNLLASAQVGYTVLPGLEIRSSFGYNSLQTDEIFTNPTTTNDPAYNITTGATNFNTLHSRSWIIEPQLNYKLQLGKGTLTALAGSTFNDRSSSSQNLYASGFLSDALLENIQAAGSIYVSSSTAAQYKYEAIFGRLNYNWEDKYLVNLTARRDGSSRFGPGKQFANFGAVGAAWIFSKEDFFQQLRFLSFGKLRGSYGTAGNDQIGDYKFLDLYSTTEFPYQGLQGLYPATLFNPDLAWEINKKAEIGLELGFLKDRITVTGSYFRNRSGNQLVSTPISQVTGYGAVESNLKALVQNTGQEYVLRTVNIKTNHFTWTSGFNVTISRNKLVKFPNLSTSPYQSRFTIGQPVSILRVYRSAGVNDTTGLFQFKTAKGEMTYSPNILTDYTTVNTTPAFYGGFQNNLTYKGISLDFLFQFVKQKGENIFGAYGGQPGARSNEYTAILDHWQKPGDKARYQRFSQSYSGKVYDELQYAKQSDFVYSDASFIRLKNVALSWQLPASWRQKIKTENVRIYIQAQNLFTISKYNGIDPESQGMTQPPLQVWTAGCQILF